MKAPRYIETSEAIRQKHTVTSQEIWILSNTAVLAGAVVLRESKLCLTVSAAVIFSALPGHKSCEIMKKINVFQKVILVCMFQGFWEKIKHVSKRYFGWHVSGTLEKIKHVSKRYFGWHFQGLWKKSNMFQKRYFSWHVSGVLRKIKHVSKRYFGLRVSGILGKIKHVSKRYFGLRVSGILEKIKHISKKVFWLACFRDFGKN